MQGKLAGLEVMMPAETVSISLYVLGLVAVLVVARLLAKPIKIMFRLLLNTLFGGLALILVNTFFGSWSIHIGVNPLTAAVCGVLGLPGFLLLIVLKLIFQG